MIGQPQGLFSGMNQDDFMRLIQMLQSQPKGMMTQPMMLAGSGVSAQTEAELRRLGVHPSQLDKTAPAPQNTGYSLGKEAPGQLDMEQRQRNASAAKLGMQPGKNYTDDEIRAEFFRQRRGKR